MPHFLPVVSGSKPLTFQHGRGSQPQRTPTKGERKETVSRRTRCTVTSSVFQTLYKILPVRKNGSIDETVFIRGNEDAQVQCE
jgi:hypothetical protein